MLSYEEYEILEKINELIEKKDWKKIKKRLANLPASDIAYIFENSGSETELLLVRLLPNEKAAKVFSELEIDEQESILKNIGNEKVKQLILELPPDDRTELFVDNKWHLIDSLPIRKFILADPGDSIESIMDYKFISISAYEDQEEAAKKIQKYNLVALPVVDKEGVLMGIVTIDDILDVLEEETTEDFHKGAAVSPVGINYTTASPWMLYTKRVLWLLILLVTRVISSTIVAHF